jgi:hypothetical protein
MTSKPEIGKYLWRETIVRGRTATLSARRALKRLLEEELGPQSQAMVIAKVALAIGDMDSVLNELDEIGRNAKNGT